MKRLLTKMILPALGLGFMITACNDWTELEPKYVSDLTQSNKSDEYYEALRAYKQSDHAVAFGWYGNVTGIGVNLENCLAGLPDSVDFVSLWGGWKGMTPEVQKDLKYVQTVKGTKALACCIIMEMGDQITPEEHNASREERHKYWGWVDGDEEAIKASIVKFANAFADTIDKYNLDGFDLDWEPSYAQPFQTNKEMCYNGRIAIFLQTLIDRGMGARAGKVSCWLLTENRNIAKFLPKWVRISIISSDRPMAQEVTKVWMADWPESLLIMMEYLHQKSVPKNLSYVRILKAMH